MLFGFSLIGCLETFTNSEGTVTAESQSSVESSHCVYYIKAAINSYVALNLTHFHGFPTASQNTPQKEEKESAKCRPLVQIMEVVGEGSERHLAMTCIATPQVFHSNSHMVKIAFYWSPHQPSGFTLTYSFITRDSVCQFECGDGTCLPDINLVCNGVSDCSETELDEKKCLKSTNPSQTSPRWEPLGSSMLHVVLVGVLVTIAILCMVACVMCYYYRTGYRSSILPGAHRTASPDSTADHHQLTSHTTSQANSEVSTLCPLSEYSEYSEMFVSDTDEVVYVPGMGSETSDSVRLNAQSTLHYPPSIPISDDGEGGYIPQSALRSVYQEEMQRPFAPPPNRTIYEGESPPPYRSRSVGYLDQPWAHRNHNSQHATSRRTYSMSTTKTKHSDSVCSERIEGTVSHCVTPVTSSASPLLGRPSSSPPPFYHQSHPPATMSRTPQPPGYSDSTGPPPYSADPSADPHEV